MQVRRGDRHDGGGAADGQDHHTEHERPQQAAQHGQPGDGDGDEDDEHPHLGALVAQGPGVDGLALAPQEAPDGVGGHRLHHGDEQGQHLSEA